MSTVDYQKLNLNELKESLLFQKGTILNKSHTFKEQELHVVQIADEAEIATSEVAKSISIHLHERERKALLSIEKALSKIETGSYGQCESCGESISIKRLLARPFTDFCIDCMEEFEGNSKAIQ